MGVDVVLLSANANLLQVSIGTMKIQGGHDDRVQMQTRRTSETQIKVFLSFARSKMEEVRVR